MADVCAKNIKKYLKLPVCVITDKKFEAEFVDQQIISAYTGKHNPRWGTNFKNRNKPRDDKANGGPIDPGYLGIPPAGLGTGSRPGGHPYPSLDYYDDDFGVKGFMKKMKKKKKKREKKATGGMANISQTYDNNPTLQSQYPNKQDYLDLFSSTTTTTPTAQTAQQYTQATVAGAPPTMTGATGTVTAPAVGQTGAVTSDATVRGQLADLQSDVTTAVHDTVSIHGARRSPGGVRGPVQGHCHAGQLTLSVCRDAVGFWEGVLLGFGGSLLPP